VVAASSSGGAPGRKLASPSPQRRQVDAASAAAWHAPAVSRSLLLVHSPLVGPSCWRAVADLAREAGSEVAIPDLTGVATAPPPRWRWFADAAAEAARPLPAPVDVVAHSGAGAMLPAIALRLGARRGAMAFVDAVVPPARGRHVTPPGRRAELDAMTGADGRLPSWFDWWPPEVVEELVPDPAVRAELAAEAPRVPRALYDETVPVPPGWTTWPAVYLQLGEPYDEDAAIARDLGWPVARYDADHLAIRTDAVAVTAALDALLAEVRPVS
jgi:hypothetical protein